MPFGGLLTVGLISAGSGIASGLLGSSAAKTASGQQVAEADKALQFQESMWNQQQANQAPYLSAGTTSLGTLMQQISNGTFGAGSNGAVPSFTAPTLADAQQSPGYQFTAQQGSKGILQGAAAAGGAITGGTLKALDQYNSSLANTTYGDVFNRALSTYNAGLQGYQTNLQKQAQEFSQAYAPAQLGESAVSSLNNTGSGVASNVGNLMTGIGNAQASGTVGSSNALTSGINGATSGFLQSLMLSKILGGGSTSSSAAPSVTPAQLAQYGLTQPSGIGPG
jgi:hypothetical protein